MAATARQHRRKDGYVVDTNVAVVANNKHASASSACVAACAEALYEVQKGGILYIDAEGEIVAEYRKRLAAKGEPGVGDAFLKWVLTNEWSNKAVVRVNTDAALERKLLETLRKINVDPSDLKFIKVAALVQPPPPILQALDSKWWGWTAQLDKEGISVSHLCPSEIEALHAKKLGD